MAWQMRGQLIENCSCNVLCPCWFAAPEVTVMDRGWCAGAFALRVEEGDFDGVDLSGRTATIGVHFPGPTMFDGNGTARVYVDDAATDEQRAALEAIIQGQNGGPPERLAPLISTWLPTADTQIKVDHDGETITVDLGDAGSLISQPLRDPEGNGFTLHGGGFVGGMGLPEGDIAPSRGSVRSDSDFPETDVEMKSGLRGAFSWSG
jgi:hypothetical protein